MYKIKEDLNFEQCMGYLLELQKHITDCSVSCGELEYLLVNFEEAKPILDEILDNSDDYYSKVMYENDDNQIEIDQIICLICEKFNKSIFYSTKNGFYV